MQENSEFKSKKTKKSILVFLGYLLSLCMLFVVCVYYYTTAPTYPQEGLLLEVQKGMTTKEIAQEAKLQGIVRSQTLLYLILSYRHDPTNIYAGIYYFKDPQSVFNVAKKLSDSDIEKTTISITIPEGSTRKEIAEIIVQKIPTFNTILFLEETKNLEGYLFPDTYFVSPDFGAEEFVNLLSETFTEKFSSYKQQLETPKLTEYEVLILASILEKEANDETSMRMVSGILQNRLAIDMALQVDASVGYILDKPLYELEATDLEIDTPYNTYLYGGLPPTPIGNPGLLAIDAVLHPTPSSYMFYITGDDGTFYYAKTFEEHKRNVNNYLR